MSNDVCEVACYGVVCFESSSVWLTDSDSSNGVTKSFRAVSSSSWRSKTSRSGTCRRTRTLRQLQGKITILLRTRCLRQPFHQPNCVQSSLRGSAT